MAKVGLDAICAKLSRNAEISSREVADGSCSPHNDDSDGGSAVPDSQHTAGLDDVDDKQQTPPAAGPVTSPVVVGRDSVMTMMIDGELVTSRPVDRATSLMDCSSGYGDETAFDGDAVDDAWTACNFGRRSRRKNFLPRYVQDGGAVVTRRPADAAAAASTPVENVEDDQAAVLDLRTVRSLTRRTADLPAAALDDDTGEDQILDLSVARCCSRDGAGESRRSPSSAAGDATTSDMRLYAVDTMTELLHIYGLPPADEQQFAVTDRRNVSGGTGARTLTASAGGGSDIAAGTTDDTATTSSTVNRVPRDVIEHKQQHAAALAHHLKGLRCAAHTLFELKPMLINPKIH